MSIKIGEFTIVPVDPEYMDGCDYWIKHDDGEGMSTTKEKLEEMLKKFWSEEF